MRKNRAGSPCKLCVIPQVFSYLRPQSHGNFGQSVWHLMRAIKKIKARRKRR